MESWSLKTQELILNWESEEDRLSDLNNTLQTLEYKLVGISFSTTTTVYNMNVSHVRTSRTICDEDLSVARSQFPGNYLATTAHY